MRVGKTFCFLLGLIVFLGAYGAALANESGASGGAPAEATGGDDENTFHVYWRDGLRFDTADGRIKLKIGGRLQNDWMFGSGDEALESALGEVSGGTEFRRAWLHVSGTLYNVIEFKAQYGLEGGDVTIKDAYIGIRSIPTLGTFRIGHFKEPFSLEEITGSGYTTFLERSLPNVFAPSRNNGFAVMNRASGITWALGVFRDTDGYGVLKDNEEDWALTGRLTALPWNEDGGRRLLHLGGAFSIRSPNDDVLRYRQRPEAHLTYRFVDTSSFAAESVNLYGLEAALVYNSFSLQGEYVSAAVSSDQLGDPSFNGYYLFATYFLTGEHRRYSGSSASFSRLPPNRNFGFDGGMGAWEVCLRYSHLDLTDGLVFGGVLDDFTIALNWYANPNTRFMFNYVYADREDVGAANIFQMRFHIDF